MVEPFWVFERDYFYKLNKVAQECMNAETLYDAIKCGFNNVYLDGEPQGWVDENGFIQGTDKTDGELKSIKVCFDRFDHDGDAYTVAFFESA